MIPESIRIASPTGSYAIVHPFGARLLQLWVPESSGALVNVVVGYSNIETYMQFPDDLIGATVGRLAGRVKEGLFVNDDVTLRLNRNHGEHHLHGGGPGALDRARWSVTTHSDSEVTLSYTCPAETNGYPGNLNLQATYAMSESSTLTVTYTATTDAPSPVNITHHSYWNLSGTRNETIGSHAVHINSHKVVDTVGNIPTGTVSSVTNTELDYGAPTTLNTRRWIDLDHLFLLENTSTHVALEHPGSGIRLEVSSKEPAVQIYAGMSLTDQRLTNKSTIGPSDGIAIEPQHVNAYLPGYTNTQSTVLQPGEIYLNQIVYRLSLSSTDVC